MINVTFKKKPFKDAERYKLLSTYLANHCCIVGFWSSDTSKKGTTYKELAKIHEYGTDTIPKRPFMEPAFKKSKKEVAQMLQENYTLYLTNKLGLNSVFALPAMRLKDKIQEEFGSALMKPLSPRTITKARGGKSAKPLLDTGNLQRSIAYVTINKHAAFGYTNA